MWTLIKDGYPPKDQRVLVTVHHRRYTEKHGWEDYNFVTQARYHPETRYINGEPYNTKWIASGYCETEHNEVIAWMPFPEPYKPDLYVITTPMNAMQTHNGMVMVFRSNESAQKVIDETEEKMKRNGFGDWCGCMYAKQINDLSSIDAKYVIMDDLQEGE